METKRHNPEEIVTKLQRVEVMCKPGEPRVTTYGL